MLWTACKNSKSACSHTQAVTQDTSLQAYIRLLTAAVPSDSVFRALGTNWLTYLLYLCLGPCPWSFAFSLALYNPRWGNASSHELDIGEWRSLASCYSLTTDHGAVFLLSLLLPYSFTFWLLVRGFACIYCVFFPFENTTDVAVVIITRN